MNSDDVVELVKTSASSMGRSLQFYWPPCKKNDIVEVNITLHVSSTLTAAGFLVYGEVHDQDKANVRIDLLGVHPEKRQLILGEFKRLWKPEMATAMVHDLDRMRTWRLSPQRAQPSFHADYLYGLLAATTWDTDYVDWFNNPARSTGPSSRGLGPLAERIVGADVRWGSTLVLKDAPVEILGPTDEWLVYVVFPLAQ
jgi:hypothetical protein